MPSAEVRGFHRPATVGEALRLAHELGSGAAFLAGGTWLNSSACTRPISDVISLKDLPLRHIERDPRGLLIGAMVTLQELRESPLVPPALRDALAGVASRNIRNQATLGGTLGACRHAAGIVPALLVLDAVAIVESPGSAAMIHADEYLAGAARGDAVAGGSRTLVTGILLPTRNGRTFGSAHLARTSSSLPIVAGAVSLERQGDRLLRPIVALGGATFDAMRLRAAEEDLADGPLPDALVLEERILSTLALAADAENGADFKNRLAATLLARAVAAAFAGN